MRFNKTTLRFGLLALVLAATPFLSTSHQSAAQLATPLNNAVSSLSTAHTSGSGTLILKTGEGARFGTPTVDAPIRVTVAARSTLVNGQIAPTSTQTIFLVTGRTGDTLTGLTATEGTADQNFTRNDPVASLITAGTISEISDVVAAIDVDLTEISETVDTVAADVATKAEDAAVVKLAGDQSIAGVKTHTGTVDLRIPAGGYAQRVWADNTAFPYSLAAVTGAVGNIATGAWVTISQNRNAIGDHIGITEAHAFDGANIEGSMLSVWPDINGPGGKFQSASGNPGVGTENATCLALYNADDPDANFYPSAYAAQSGKKQAVIWGDGRIDWGVNLGKLPATNRTASLYRDPANNFLTLTSTAGIQLPGVKFTEAAAAGDGLHPVLTLGDVSPTVAALFSRKASAQNLYFGESTDTGSTFFRGRGGLVATASIASGSTYAAVQNVAGNGTSNEARLYLAPHSGFTFPDTSPYISSYNVGNNAGFRFSTYNGGMTVPVTIAPAGDVTLTGGLQIGGGTKILKVLSATATLDFPSTAPATSADLTVTVAGAAVGDSVSLGLPASIPANTSFLSWISAANTATVRFNNYSAGAIDPASGTFRVTDHQF